MVHCDYCSAYILEFAMTELVEQILNTYKSMHLLSAEQVEIRGKKLADMFKPSLLLASAMMSS
jgi:hypothetical protein